MTTLQAIRESRAELFAIPTAVCLLFVVAGCDSQQSTSSAPLVKDYTGEQIFRGLLFGQGEVANLFPEIWEEGKISNSSELKNALEDDGKILEEAIKSPQALRAYDVLVSQIQESHPDFFTEFEQAMESGNHLQVRNALSESGYVLADAAKALTSGQAILKGTPKTVANALRSYTSASAKAEVTVYVETAVVAIAVAVVLFFITQVDATPVAPAGVSETETLSAQQSSMLERDQIVNLVVKQLGQY